ncbi:glycoside hydrolase family 5 protein [Methylocucumis oryzae]|uniref:Exo-1,3-beta-glucanase D n=1 Tax=Methylocucumis oryzae TaxID=1632867 RepID=A0A0F3IGM8_9GAMM|nr:glycoside hydrolase family 5 protein [Methylocucumis oryzae]KJV05857.1 glucan 1,3-beta-glucosidase [Methylocucumis oryzae]
MSSVFENKYGKKIRGVNLGSWLVVEKWMVPSLFEGLAATDETSLCVELGDRAQETMQRHWQTFITRDDFVWLAEIGINAVRIPVGHWLFGPDYPYHPAYQDVRYPFAQGGVEILDQAFSWAEELGILIVLDLHAAPGCQNGFDNGGIKDVCEWHTDETYIDYSLTVLERLAERYKNSPALHGIEVLNEPRWDVPTELLKKYYANAYQRIRQHCRVEDVAVVIHDGFRSHTEFSGFLVQPEADNVIFDIHRYQCFVREEIDLDIYGHAQKSVVDWKQEADAINNDRGHWGIVGEWSLGVDIHVVSLWATGPYNHAMEGMDAFQLDVAYRLYASSQLAAFEKYLGWFFWNYKTETTPAWCFKECVKHGWLPARFN